MLTRLSDMMSFMISFVHLLFERNGKNIGTTLCERKENTLYDLSAF